ncbi:hypothetical protein [Modestobacter altitudinis]|uniref:hypothetical protein n=1 Tax=Modestobacter altitudinis TaxID=2213158 RepID=UPI001C5565BE|nr:hypothetical protein [Modestobacter altitudinis]
MKGGREVEGSGPDHSRLTAAERRDAERLQAYRRKRRLVRAGQVLMALGLVTAIVHWLGHIGVFGGQPSGLNDLLAGYPAAAVVFFLGAILAGQ